MGNMQSPAVDDEFRDNPEVSSNYISGDMEEAVFPSTSAGADDGDGDGADSTSGYRNSELTNSRGDEEAIPERNNGGVVEELSSLIEANEWVEVLRYLDRDADMIPPGALEYSSPLFGNASILQRALIHSAPSRLLKRLIDVGGTSLVSMRDRGGHTATHYMSMGTVDVVQHLRQVCGLEIFHEKNAEGGMPLHTIIQDEAPLPIIIFFVEQARQTLHAKNNNGLMPVHEAVRNKSPYTVIEYLVNAYPQSLLEKTRSGWIPLHQAISNGSSQGVIQLLVRKGGSQSILELSGDGFNAIHLAVQKSTPLHVIEYLTEQAGSGKEVLQKKTPLNLLPLHFACGNPNTPLSVFTFLIDKGGEDTLLQRSNDGVNPLGFAVANISSLDIISYLTERGGVETLRQKKNGGLLALHLALAQNAPFDVIKHLCDKGGRETLIEKTDDGLFAIHYAIFCRASPEIVTYIHDKGGREIYFEANTEKFIPTAYAVWYKTILSVDLENNEEYNEGGQKGWNNQSDELLNLFLDKNSDRIMRYLERDDIPQDALNCLDLNHNQMSILQRALWDFAPHFIIKRLVEVGGNDLVSIRDQFGNNPIHYINDSTSTESISLLLQSCGVTSLRQKNNSGYLPIHTLIRKIESIDVISALIVIGGVATLEEKDNYGWIPLHHAVDTQASLEIVKLLVITGGKGTLRVAENSAGYLPIHMATSKGNLDVISYLTKEGGGKEALFLKSSHGLLPMHCCCSAKNGIEIAKFFIAEGGNDLLLEKDNYDFLPIHHAVRQGDNLELIEFLIEEGGRHTLRSRTDAGLIPLHFAVSTDSLEMVKLLIKEGGTNTLHCATADKSLPLHIAVREKSPEIISYIVELGGVKTLLAEDTGGWLVAHIACNYGTLRSIFKCIIEQGGKAALLHTNEFHATPLELLYNGRNKDAELVTLIHNLALQIGLTPSDCSEKTIMATLNWANSLDVASETEIMKTDKFVKMALNDKFTKSRATVFMILLDIAFQATAVVIYSFSVDLYDGKKNFNHAFPITILCLSFFMLRESIEMSSTPIRVYIGQASNWVDQSQIFLMLWSVHYFRRQVDIPTETERTLFVWAATLTWVNILFKLGNIWYPLSVLVAALVAIAQQLIPFIFTSVIVTFAFAHLFRIRYASAPNKECYDADQWTQTDGWRDNWMSCDVTISYLKTVTMFLDSGVWAEHWNFDGNIWLMIGFAFVVGLLLLNIVIAVVSNIFTAVQASAERAFWMNRINIVCEIDSMLTLFNKLHQSIVGCFQNRNSLRKLREACRSCSNANTKFARFSFAIPPGNDEELQALPSGVGKWWFRSQEVAPSIYFRMWTFYSFALWREILFPDAEFEAVLLGRNVKSESGGSTIEMFDYVRDMRNLPESRTLGTTIVLFCARIMSWLFFIVHMVFVLLVFLIGLGTFGILWSPAMKDYLFNAGLSDDNIKKKTLEEAFPSTPKSTHSQLEAEVETLKSEVVNMKQEIADLKNSVMESHDKMMNVMNTILSELQQQENT